MARTKTSVNREWFPEKRTIIRRTIPFLLIGLLIFVGYLYLFVDIPALLTIIQDADLSYYLLAVVFFLFNMLTYSLTWHYFLRPLSINVTLWKNFLITCVGTFVEFFVPSESIGEDVSRTYLMTKESGENTGKVVASVLAHRFLSITANLTALITCSIILFISHRELHVLVSNLILFTVFGTAILLIFIFLLCVRKELMQKLVDLLLRFVAFISRGHLKLDSLRSKARKTLEAFHGSIEIFGKNPSSLVQPALFSVLNYFLGIFVAYLVFLSLGHPVSFVLLIVVYSISHSVQSIPTLLPGEVGFLEIVMTTLYGLLGVPLGIAAAATILTRILWVWFRLLPGFVALQWVINRGLV